MYGVLENIQALGIDSFSFRVLSMVVGAAFIGTLFFMKKIKLTRGRIVLIIFALAYLSIYGAINYLRLNAYLEGFFIPFFLATVICCFYSGRDLFELFFETYKNVIVFLAFISIFFYFGGTLLKIIPGIPMSYTNNGWWNSGTNYYYLSFINDWQTVSIGGNSIIRNIGIYMEAPGFAVALVYALWWEMIGSNRPIKKSNIIILLITIITTFSAKAYSIAVIVLFVYAYLQKENIGKWWKRIRIIFLPIILILAIVIIVSSIGSRMANSGSGLSSFAIRSYDYVATIRAWLDHPLFGCGFNNLQTLYTYYPVDRHSGTSTAGLFNILAFGGVYMLVFYIVTLVSYIIKASSLGGYLKTGSFILLIVLNLVTGSTQYSYFLIFMMAYGLMLKSR